MSIASRARRSEREPFHKVSFAERRDLEKFPMHKADFRPPTIRGVMFKGAAPRMPWPSFGNPFGLV